MKGVKDVIFFDSKCRLCRNSVLFILKEDKKRRFFFAPLSGKTATLTLRGSRFHLLNAASLILIEECGSSIEKTWIKARAVFRILWLLGGKWKLLGWLYACPLGLDFFYTLIAKRRHLITKEPLPPFPDDKHERFLS